MASKAPVMSVAVVEHTAFVKVPGRANFATSVEFKTLINELRPTPTKEEISRNCLQAHELLMRINPDNIPKFKEVTQFLAEDLRRMKENGSGRR